MTRRSDWPVRLAACTGAAVCVAGAMALGPVVGIQEFWPGMFAIVVAIVLGIILGRFVGGLLFPSSSGSSPEDNRGMS